MNSGVDLKFSMYVIDFFARYSTVWIGSLCYCHRVKRGAQCNIFSCGRRWSKGRMWNLITLTTSALPARNSDVFVVNFRNDRKSPIWSLIYTWQLNLSSNGVRSIIFNTRINVCFCWLSFLMHRQSARIVVDDWSNRSPKSLRWSAAAWWMCYVHNVDEQRSSLFVVVK